MGVTATTRLPAGWYPDPDGENQRRWWDGRAWTQYTAEFQRPVSVDELELSPPAPSTTKPNKISRTERRLKRAPTSAAETSTAKAATAKTTHPAESDGGGKKKHAAAERLGRWLAGAVHRAPTPRKPARGRRANRETP